MNVKTLKRMSKRSVSVLLTVLMIISLFTVCMVGTTVTAGAANSIGGKTITLKVSGWQNAHVFVGKGDYTSHYTMSGSNGKFTVTFPKDHHWNDDKTYYFFSDTNYNNMGDGAGVGTGISTVYDSLKGNSNCSNLIDKAVNDIEKGNVYTVNADGTFTVSSSSSTPSSSGWINATMYNYRTASQIADAMQKAGTLTEEQNYTVDSTGGQAKEIFAESVYQQYNAAVADWFKSHSSTDGKAANGVSVTPLYQGNIRASNDAADETGTLDWATKYFNFVSVANGANRFGESSTSINAAAVGLVDKTLSANGTIQQNGIELPQFSDAFMNANADSKIQSKYENLKFETNVRKSDAGNEWYSYNSSNDKNRSLDITNRQIKNYNNVVKGCKNANGDQNATAGYYPFNQTQPGDTDNITNCFGTRFDIDYAMPNADGKVNGEEMQFNFTGDDDMWVYIDGHLVLDLGGSHAMASGSINLAKMKVTYSTGYYNATYDKVADKNSASCAYTERGEFPIGSDVQKILKDTTRTHKMTIFYMERGLFDSNLSFDFFLPQTNSLTVEQKTDTSNVNSALVKDTLQTADKDVFQTYIVSNSKSAASNNTASVTEDFTRKDVYGNTQVLQKGSSSAAQTGTPFTNSMTSGDGFTPIGNTNFVWEDKNSTNTTKGKGTPTGDGTVELLYNQSATFNDQFANGSQFRLTKLEPLKSFDLPNLTENQPTSSENERNRHDYYDTELKVTDNSGSELTLNGGAYNFGDSSDNVVKVKAEYTDKVKVGSVAFTKNIEGDNPETNAVFKFKIQMRNIFGGTSDTEWKVYDGLKVTVTGITGEKPLGSDGTVELKNGETLTIDGVPVGTEYRITEVESGDYSVSSVVCDSTVANKSNMVSETNGFNAKLPTSGGTASYTVNNTKEKVTVLYRYQDRAVETGLPTDLENHYTYFKRNIAGNINNIVDTTTGNLTEDGKKKLKASLPEVSNVLMSYSVEDDIQKNVDYITLTNDYLNEELRLLTNKPNNPDHTAEGVPAEIQALVNSGTKVLVVTYTAVQKDYTVNLTFPQLQDDRSYAVKTLSEKGHFNSLILNNETDSKDYTAPKEYTDADGVKHTFKYWAKRVAIEGGASSNKKWVPVSTNYTYNYRITDNMELKAVYDTDEDYTQLDAPEVTVENPITYMPTGKDTGYAAAASERIYDSYSKDNTDRTRVNVIFDAVGSADLDTGISAIGYVLIKNKGSYANASEFTEADIKDAITLTTSKIKSHDALIKYYTVVGRGNFDGTDYDQTGTQWNGRYNAGQVNLTNKNRANIVFDLKNTEASHNNYFTCYTVMKREGKTYVSKSPAYFNLGEADPNVTPDTPTENTYNIATSARYTTDNGKTYISGTKAGYVLSNGVRFVTEGKTVKVSYYPTSYAEGDRQYVSRLESLKIGKQTITSDDFALLGIDPTKNGSYQFTFSKDKYLGADAAAGATLEIVASFKAEANANYITVTAPTNVTNGTVTIGINDTEQKDGTLAVEKGGSFYVKATADTGFYFKNWTVNETTIKDNPVKVDVAKNGTLSVNGTAVTMADLKPVFVQTINVTLTSGTGGTISYSCTYNGKKVADGTVAENSTEIVKVPAETTFKLTANPKSGYNFAKWGGNLSSTPNPVVETTWHGDGTITAEFEQAPNKTLYLKLGCNEWKAGNQRFVAVLKNPEEKPIVMTMVDNELYRVEMPSNIDYKEVTFCKMKNSNDQFNWDDREYQTYNLTIPTDGKMMYTVTKQDGTQYATGEWSAAPDDNTVTVTAPTVANGTVTIGTDASTQELATLKVPKGTSFYVKAAPNTGFTFKNWTVNGTTISDNPVMVSVSDTGTLSVNNITISSLDDLVPTFEGGTTGDTTPVYLKLDHVDWQNDSIARYEAYVYDSNGHTYWIPMTKAGDKLYKADVPNTVIEAVKDCQKNIIFLRFDKNDPDNDFNKKWNQTLDQKIPTDGKTTFSVNSREGTDSNARYDGKWLTPQS